MKRFLLLLLCATMTFRITSFSSFAEGIVDVTESESVGMEANGTAESPSAIEETEAAESTGTIEETEATDDTSAIEETEGTSAVEETEAEESTSTIEETEATEDTSAIEETEGTSTVEKTEAVESTSAIEETEATEGTSAIEETEAVVSTGAIEEIEEVENTTINDRTIVSQINAELAKYEPLDTPPADLLDEDAPDPASHIISMGDNTVVSGWGYTFTPPEYGDYLIETVGAKDPSVTIVNFQDGYIDIGDMTVCNSYGPDGVNVEQLITLECQTYIIITRDAIVDSFILRITRVELNYGQDDDDDEEEEFEDWNDCNDIIEEEEEEESTSEEELEIIDKNANSSAGETVTDNCVNSEKDPSTEPSTDKNLNPVKSPETGDSGVPFIYLPAMLAAGVLVFIERKRMIR